MRMSAAIGGQEGASDSLSSIVTDDGEPTCGCRNTPVRTAGILNHWANSTAPHSAYQTVESSNITLLF